MVNWLILRLCRPVSQGESLRWYEWPAPNVQFTGIRYSGLMPIVAALTILMWVSSLWWSFTKSATAHYSKRLGYNAGLEMFKANESLILGQMSEASRKLMLWTSEFSENLPQELSEDMAILSAKIDVLVDQIKKL